MTVGVARPLLQVLHDHAGRLRAAGIEPAEREVLLLARHVLGLDAAGVRAATTADVPAGRLDRLEHLVTRRAARVPLQHLTGGAGFRHLDLVVRPGVFVPRPETEVLAGAAVAAAAEVVASGRRAVVVEPCTGTGAVALALATEVDGVDVVATDRSPDAVALARANLAAVEEAPGLGGSTVRVLLGDLLAPVPAELAGRVDVLVSNPPYLTPAEVAASPPEVRDHEPLDALVGGPDGAEVVDRLLDEGRRWLRPGGVLLLEVGPASAGVHVAAARALGYEAVAVVADLTGRDRVLRARAPEGS